MYKSNDSVEIAKLMSRFNYDESKKSEVLEKYDTLTKLVDLHTHTSYSDGMLSPIEVLDLAKKRKCWPFIHNRSWYSWRN